MHMFYRRGLGADVSWIIEDKLAAGSMPYSEEELEIWKDLGIKAVLVLVEEHELVEAGWENYFRKLEEKGFTYKHLPIRDMHVPTLERALEAVRWMDSQINAGRRVLVHCNAGLGRTGTIVACYLVYKIDMVPRKAIEYVREKRPGSLETYWQVAFVLEFSSYLSSIKSK